MTTTVISERIAAYLESAGFGTLASTIFHDYQPDADVDTISVFDLGGSQQMSLAPDLWREIYVQVRCKEHAAGYETVWGLLNVLLYPTDGQIVIGPDKYSAQFREIPAITDRDKTNRYLFGFTVVVQKVVTISDAWLDALADWTQAILGSSWTVYKGLPDGKFPHVVWQMTDAKVSNESGIAAFEVTKTFTGTVMANDPTQQIAGVTTIVTELGNAIKIPLNIVDRRYLTVDSVSANVRPGDNRTGTIDLTLKRRTNRPAADAPVIMSVTIDSGIIKAR